MKILNIEVSDRASNIIDKIGVSLKKPVKFYDINNIGRDSFGAADVSEKSNHYKIYTKTNLFGEAFETNIIHEMYHIVQIEEGFPYTSTLKNALTCKDIGFYENIGSAVTSALLDLDVYERLCKQGYNSEFFYLKRYKNAKQIIELNNGLPIVDRYDIVYFVALMIYFLSYNPYSKMEYVVHKIEKTNPDIYLLAKQLYESITNIGFDTPEKSFRCLSDMFTKLDVWNIQTIGYKNITFFNASEVETFLLHNSIT